MKIQITWRRILDFVAITGAMAGSALVASDAGPKVGAIGYALFFVSTLAAIVILRRTNGANSLIFINCYFTVVNLIGIYQRLF